MIAARGWGVIVLHLCGLFWTTATQMQGDFISIYQKALSQFPVLVILLMILSPAWAVFITRKSNIYGLFVFAISIIFLIFLLLYNCTINPFYSLPVWVIWFIYAFVMLLLGLSGILFRIITNKEKVETTSVD